MHEVISHQSAELRDFLMTTALLNRFCADLFDFLVPEEPGHADSRKLIEKLERENLFLVPHSYQKMFQWDFSGIALLLDQAEQLLQDPALPLSEEKRKSLLGDIDVLHSFGLYWQGDAKGALRHTQRALRVVPRQHRYAHTTAFWGWR